MKTNAIRKIFALAAVAALSVPLVASARPPQRPPPSQVRPQQVQPRCQPQQTHRHRPPRPHGGPRPYVTYWTPPPPPPYWYYPPPPPPPAYYYYGQPGVSFVFTF